MHSTVLMLQKDRVSVFKELIISVKCTYEVTTIYCDKCYIDGFDKVQ